MGIEIERRFLVTDEAWIQACHLILPKDIVQGYLVSGPVSLRVRRTTYNGHSRTMIGIKGVGEIERPEFEYIIPENDFVDMLELCGSMLIKKKRYCIRDGHDWEIDEFSGIHEGLVIAEVELLFSDEPVDVPQWAGKEITGDVRYSNAYLAEHGAWWR